MRTLLAIGLLAACGGTDEPPLTDATSLDCPAPGDLPFRLMSHGFQNSANVSFAANNPRDKSEASEALGNPSGKQANTYIDDAMSADASPIAYQGAKARTTATNGLVSNALAGENVSLWFYDATAMMWNQLARTQTDANGDYDFTDTSFVAPNEAPIYSMLEADGSCDAHHDFLLPAGSKVIVVDIDGTLTTDDNQLIMQISDDTYVPALMTAADKMTQAWAAKGYPVIYLTARPHVFDIETKVWLDMFAFPPGPVITSNGQSAADVYKTAWLKRMTNDFGWDVFAAYGNASTDITAYANDGIALDHTFIIGPEGGMGGTVAIPNMDYTAHIASFIAAQPDNN